MPRVELISDVFHYYYTALALHRQGFLGHYITGPSLLSDEGALARLGGPFRRLWTERRLDGLPSRKVRRTWVPELMRRAFREWADPLNAPTMFTTSGSRAGPR